jgi:glycosyltransferase involved in cell wall biosynthesis
MKSAPSFAAKLAAHLEGRIMRAAHGVVAIHDRFKDFMVNSLGIPPESVRVIRNWTHLPETPPFLREEIRRRLGWRQDDIVVLHAGNMGRKQGLENVVAAAGLAQERRSRVRFVLMGDGNQRNMLEKMATNVSNITFLDPLPDGHFQQALGAADFLLVNELPGIREMSVPSKLTSYFDAGVPVIAATDLGSVTASEIELSGGGVRVNAGSPADLLSMAERLSSDRERSKNMGRRGHQFRLEILSEASAIRQYDEFLVELASQATNRRSVS